MSQTTDPNSLALPATESTPMDPSTVVESYADHLMEELFDGVDRALEGDEQAVLTLTKPPLPTAAEAEGTSSTLLAPPPALDVSSQAIAELLRPPVIKKKQRWWSQPLNRYILAGSVVTMAILGGLIALYQQRLAQVELAAVPSIDTPPQIPISTDAEFLNYLKRALDVVSSQANTVAQQPPATASVENISNLPSPVAMVPPTPQPGATTSSLPGQLNVVERVYIPYQPPSQPAVTPSNPTNPGQASSAPAVASQPSGVALKTHVLVGILELGDRSAALVEIDGVSQRVYIGERIGDSNWSLVSVSNQEAVIRRNGELQSIFVGQQF